jgi:hypothetical protein
MQIHITLTQVRPPAGTLRVPAAPGPDGDERSEGEIGFTGWLGMLRALSELIGPPGDQANPG